MFESALLFNQNLFFKTFGFAGLNSVLDTIMVFFANYLILISLFLIFFLAFKGSLKERKALRLILLAVGIGFIFIEILGKIINEPRPYITYHISPLIGNLPDASFPSEHTTVMTILAACYIYYKSKYAPFFSTALILTGIARVYVGVHYPFDIVGGIVLGILSVWIAIRIKTALMNKLAA